MSNKIDMNSAEFIKELDKTEKFTDKVNKTFNWVYNPNEEINEGIKLGLTRNKLMFGKRFCPCFMVEEVDGKPQSVDNRICPCKPAIEKEIPETGVCHCQIFCTPEFAAKQAVTDAIEEKTHNHKNILTKEEANILIKKQRIDGDELVALLEARSENIIEFKLIDVREPMEWNRGHIDGADMLISTSNFYQIFNEALDNGKISKEDNLIVYCQLDSRSKYISNMLTDKEYQVTDLMHGINGYHGLIIK